MCSTHSDNSDKEMRFGCCPTDRRHDTFCTYNSSRSKNGICITYISPRLRRQTTRVEDFLRSWPRRRVACLALFTCQYPPIRRYTSLPYAHATFTVPNLSSSNNSFSIPLQCIVPSLPGLILALTIPSHFQSVCSSSQPRPVPAPTEFPLISQHTQRCALSENQLLRGKNTER